MTAKELIDAIEEHVGPETFTDALNGDNDALDIDVLVDLTVFGTGKRHLIDLHDDNGPMLVVGERAA